MRKLIYGALALSASMAVGFGVGANDAKAALTPTANIDEISLDGSDTLTIKTVANNVGKVLVGGSVI